MDGRAVIGMRQRVTQLEQRARLQRYQEFYWEPRQSLGNYMIALYRLWLDVSDRVPGRMAAQRVINSMRQQHLRDLAQEVYFDLVAFRAGVGDDLNFTSYIVEFIRRYERIRPIVPAAPVVAAAPPPPPLLPTEWVYPEEEAPPSQEDKEDEVAPPPPPEKELHHGEPSGKRPRLV